MKEIRIILDTGFDKIVTVYLISNPKAYQYAQYDITQYLAESKNFTVEFE
jgi:hypothetical protein